MAELIEYKCPCCGGAISFDSSLQQMKCPYCDTTFEVETLRNYDEELQNRPEEQMEWEDFTGGEWQEGETEGMKVYVCQSCGGEIVGDENTAATKCPFCDNPVVIKGQFSGELRPDYVIPFQLNKSGAKEAMKKHLRGKTLLPKVFKDENHIDEIKGIYVPFWLFNTKANANIHYKGTKVRSWSDSKYHYTETSTYQIVREGDIAFERIPVDGSSLMSDDLMESIEPFDWKDAVEFQTAYLAGYLADKYDVDAQQSKSRANERVKESTQAEFRSTVNGYSSVVPTSSNIQLREGSVKYALYPVWILNTTWRNQKYTFAMNGQTGKFVGNLPLDKGAFCRWLFGIWGGVCAAAYGLWLMISSLI